MKLTHKIEEQKIEAIKRTSSVTLDQPSVKIEPRVKPQPVPEIEGPPKTFKEA